MGRGAERSYGVIGSPRRGRQRRAGPHPRESERERKRGRRKYQIRLAIAVAVGYWSCCWASCIEGADVR